jgi:hypothetical protein
MSNTIPLAVLKDAAVRFADGLCERLDGEWRRTESIHAQASIAAGGRVLYLWGYEQAGRLRLSIQGQLPEGWTDVEEGTQPEITVAADRAIEAVAAEVTRRLLPVLDSECAIVQAALEQEAARSRILDHFLNLVPGSAPDRYNPSGAAYSRGPDLFTTELRFGLDAKSADLHLRNAPTDLISAIAVLIAVELGEEAESDVAPNDALTDLADAITTLASARKRIPVKRLVQETALNLLILGRIASNRLDDRVRRDEIESATDHLVTLLRHAAWNLPVQPASDTPQAEH